MARGDSRPIKHSSNAILSFSSFCITSLCLVFVIWKSSKCLSKFFDKPQVTEVSVQKAANFPFLQLQFVAYLGAWENIKDSTQLILKMFVVSGIQ